MSHYITDTEAQAQAQEVADFAEFQAVHGTQHASYWLVTTAWSIPVQRLDGKWIRTVCPSSTATGRTIEVYNAFWFPENPIN